MRELEEALRASWSRVEVECRSEPQESILHTTSCVSSCENIFSSVHLARQEFELI